MWRDPQTNNLRYISIKVVRFALVLISLFLSLVTSADYKSNQCDGCWLPPANSPTVTEGLGVNIHFIDPQPGEVKMIADAGFRWVRTDFIWEITERERGRYDFSAYDRLLKELDAFKIHALFILDYGNPLYTEGRSVRTTEAREAFARWALAAAKHFSGRGVVWEVFNEPNIEVFWPPAPNADEYIALASEVGRAFHTEAPNEKLIGPATAKIDLPFLESCFKAGLMNHWSGVSVHPYRHTNPESAASEYAHLRGMIDRYRTVRGSEWVFSTSMSTPGSTVSIISGEWGYSSVWRGMNEEKQAIMLARQFLTNIANGIPISIWYDWRDDGTDPAEAEHHFGLVRNQYQSGRAEAYEPKAAYLAAKTLTAQLSGYRFLERMNIGSDDDYVLAFTNGSARRIVAWTTSQTPRRVNISGVNGRFTITKTAGEKGAVISATNNSLSIELSISPVYLTSN